MGNTICCEHDLPGRRGYPYPPACLYDTVDMMVSKDYKERFKAEYWQTRIRYEKLKKLNTQLEAHEDILKDEKGPSMTVLHTCCEISSGRWANTCISWSCGRNLNTSNCERRKEHDQDDFHYYGHAAGADCGTGEEDEDRRRIRHRDAGIP